MTSNFARLFCINGIVLLAGCGGSSGDGSLGGGGSAQTLTDLEGRSLSTPAASFQANGMDPAIGAETITLDSGFFNGETADLDGTVSIFGETVAITNGSGSLSSGEEVRVTFETDRVGSWAAPIDVLVSGIGLGDINGLSSFVVGVETDPTTVAGLSSGAAIYQGDFSAFGSFNAAANADTEYEGQITVTVDFFASDTADIALIGTVSGVGLNLDAEDVAIVGNGLSGNLDCASMNCSGNTSTFDASFFGPNAEEVGGVLAIDLNVGGIEFDATGNFVIENANAP